MKFKLVENYDYYTEEARLLVQEYAYDAIDELKHASFDTYFKWFFDNIGYEEDPAILKQAVKDFYIEAVDSGKIQRPKTMITSQLKDYIESNSNLLDNVDELINNCPEHLRHELQLALDVAELNESLNEELLTEKTDARKEVSTHAFSDANNKPYKLSGLKSKIIDKYGEPLRLLCISIKNNDIQEGEALFTDICNNDQEDPWTTHHINGLHKNSSIKELSNLALIRRSLHKELTDKNKIIAERCLEGMSVTGNADIDKLICRLLVILYNQESEPRIKPSDVFRVSIHNIDNVMNEKIPQTVSSEFYTTFDKSSEKVIRLVDLENFLR